MKRATQTVTVLAAAALLVAPWLAWWQPPPASLFGGERPVGDLQISSLVDRSHAASLLMLAAGAVGLLVAGWPTLRGALAGRGLAIAPSAIGLVIALQTDGVAVIQQEGQVVRSNAGDPRAGPVAIVAICLVLLAVSAALEAVRMRRAG